MNDRLDQALKMHKMCLNELDQLKLNVESYYLASTGLSELLHTHWHEVCKGNNIALMVYDNFLTSITNIMNAARKFNIQIQLNDLKSTEKHPIFPILDAVQNEKLFENQKNCNVLITECTVDANSEYCFDPSKIVYPAEEFDVNLQSGEEFVYPKTDLNNIYKNNTIINAFVTHLKDLNNLLFCILDSSSQYSKQMVDLAQSIELHQYHSIPPAEEIFGLAHDKCILRAVRCSKVLYDQEADEEFWPCYLIDFGDVVPLRTEDITYKLTEEQKTTPALAVFCQLKSPEKNPFLNQKKLQKKLQKLIYQNCKLRVVSVEENTLQVELVEEPVNQKNNANVSKKSRSNLFQNDTNPFRESIKVDKHKLTEEELDMLYDEPLNTSNAMKAVMGYDPQDDKRICRFYNPSTGACFKGSHCKQEHVPRQLDGWTKDIVPATSIIDNHAPLVIYPRGKIINITPTYIGHFEQFYAQINDPHQNNTPLIWNDEDVPKWKHLQTPPHIFELVLARYDDDLWYRAKIISHDDDYKMFKVFYVDYGNHQIVHLRNLARIDSGMAQLPFQAVLCRMDGAKEVQSIPADKRKSGIKMLCDMILNSSIDVKVVNHYEYLFVSFVNKKDFPLPEVLIELGYMKHFKS